MSPFSFQRHQRLLNPSEFKRVFDGVEGRISHTFFLILARRSNPEQPARLGLVVAKKHLKRAVDRNAFKRIIRNEFRLSQSQLAGLDIVILARPGSAQIPQKDLAAQINKYWPKLVQRCHNPPAQKPTPRAESPK
ncbi:MAG: ribonuclease P protein component [Ketobacter sp.]